MKHPESCPCGGIVDVYANNAVAVGWIGYRIYCVKCGKHGEYMPSMKAAINDWNRSLKTGKATP